MEFSDLKKNVLLSDHTTIKLGGPAEYFYEFRSEEELTKAISFSKKNNLEIFILGGGSNVIFPDEGFKGIVLKNNIKLLDSNRNNNDLIIKAGAGNSWDELVKLCVEKGFTGIECLSGIPGFVGAVPVQNVGAYGQEIKDTLVSADAIEIQTGEKKTFTNEDCRFGYRDSRFKKEDKGKYVITSVTFRLKKDQPEIKYDQLSEKLPPEYFTENNSIENKLRVIRETVIRIRKSKSMVIDKNDPESVSCGSFFMNPVLNEKEFKMFSDKHGKDVPYFKNERNSGTQFKIPAAWLIENTGFTKGFTENGAGISSKHTLSIVNKGGKTGDIVALSVKIQQKVKEKFNISLLPEPEILKQ